MSQKEIDDILSKPRSKEDVLVSVKIKVNINALEALVAESKRRGLKSLDALIEQLAINFEMKDK